MVALWSFCRLYTRTQRCNDSDTFPCTLSIGVIHGWKEEHRQHLLSLIPRDTSLPLLLLVVFYFFLHVTTFNLRLRIEKLQPSNGFRCFSCCGPYYNHFRIAQKTTTPHQMRPIVEARDASARFGSCDEGLGRHQSIFNGRE